MLPVTLIEDEENARFIQREVGEALRLSFDAVTCEPVPANMALLLRRLALAQSLRVPLSQEKEAKGVKPLPGWGGLAA